MTSACSRWSQPPKTAISNWNGSRREVYATAVDPPVGHHDLGRLQAPVGQRPKHPLIAEAGDISLQLVQRLARGEYRVFMSGPPNALFVMKSSGMGKNFSNLPSGEIT